VQCSGDTTRSDSPRTVLSFLLVGTNFSQFKVQIDTTIPSMARAGALHQNEEIELTTFSKASQLARGNHENCEISNYNSLC
jgi:hypothetical protein